MTTQRLLEYQNTRLDADREAWSASASGELAVRITRSEGLVFEPYLRADVTLYGTSKPWRNNTVI